MSNHLFCIGVLADRELLTLSNAGKQFRWPSRAVMSVHDDVSGARLVTYVVDKTIVCSKPGFATALKRRARVLAITRDPECRYCRLLELEILGHRGDILYKQLVELETAGDLPRLIEAQKSGEAIDVTIAGFAEKVEIYDDVAAYRSAHPKASKTVGPGWVLHAGSMEKFRGKHRPPSSHLIIYGVMRDVESLIHHTTEHRFVRARVQAYESDLDVLVDSSDLPDGLRTGQILAVTCYVTGRIAPADAELEWLDESGRAGGVMYHSDREHFDRLPGKEVPNDR